ncbi:MAG: hypothetical protein Kow00108_02350 [Calditrichia bacterium]
MTNHYRPSKMQMFIGVFWTAILYGLLYLLSSVPLIGSYYHWIGGVGYTIVFILLAIWIIAYYTSIRLVIESDTIKLLKGILVEKEVTIPNRKIINVYVTRDPIQRLFGLGTIHIQTSSAISFWGLGGSEVRIAGLKNVKEIKETILEQATYEEVKEETAREKDSETLRRILEEVSKIRKMLEKQNK